MDVLQVTSIAIAAGIAPDESEPISEIHQRHAKSAGVAAANIGKLNISKVQHCNLPQL